MVQTSNYEHCVQKYSKHHLRKAIAFVFMLTIYFSVSAQTTINGTVKDANGVPLAGSNILEKGTNNGVTADFDGNFSIMVADANAVIVVSYLGFASKEIAVADDQNPTIILEEDASALDEVVLVGYGTQKKASLTGAISVVKIPEIKEQATLWTVDYRV